MLRSRRDFVLSALACVSLLAGCATWTFAPIRSARFVSENGDYLFDIHKAANEQSSKKEVS